MGVEEEFSGAVEKDTLERAKSDNRKWVGVRLSKVMMAQIEDTVESHPEWAWSNPNDFVRDAVRRHLEYIRKQNSMNKKNILGLPDKVLTLVEGMMDAPSYGEFKRRLVDIMGRLDVEREPVVFLDQATELLASFLGETLAKNIIRRLYEEVR